MKDSKKRFTRHWTVFKLDGAGDLIPVSDFHPYELDAYEWIDDAGEPYDIYYVIQGVEVRSA